MSGSELGYRLSHFFHTFGWMTRWRRLIRDYERRCDVSDTMIHVSMGALLLRRVAHP